MPYGFKSRPRYHSIKTCVNVPYTVARWGGSVVWPFHPARPVGSTLDHFVEMFVPNKRRHDILVAHVAEIVDLEESRNTVRAHQFLEMLMADSKQQGFHHFSSHDGRLYSAQGSPGRFLINHRC